MESTLRKGVLGEPPVGVGREAVAPRVRRDVLRWPLDAGECIQTDYTDRIAVDAVSRWTSQSRRW